MGGSKPQVTFHRSLVAGSESNPKPSIWLTLGLKTNLRPRVSQIEGFGYFPKHKGRTIKKVMGEGGGDGEKTKKKFMQGKMPRKKVHTKKKVKKKNSCRRKVQL